MSHSREAVLADAVMVDKMTPPVARDWWRGAVLYEIYWRSFLDTNGDGIGDLGGVARKLDYIAGLGVDAIWLAPFFPSPQEDFGYDVVDARGVDERAGTMADFRALLDGAHERGLRVLIDFIPIHTSHHHPWFKESRRDKAGPKADWYVWADAAADGSPPNNWMSSFGGSAWTWEPRRSQYYYHPFLICQPALNLQNEAVLDAVADDLRHWLEMGVDGFRLDAVQCLACDPDLRSNPPESRTGGSVLLGGGPNNPFRKQMHLFDRDVPEALPIIQRLRAVVDEFGADRVLVGELADVDSSRAAEKYTAHGDRFHAVYDFDLINCEVEDLPQMLKVREDHLRTGWLYNVFTNHDSKRAVSNFTALAQTREAQVQAAKMLIFLQFALKGGGAMFQGEELGLTHPALERQDLRDPWGINLWPDFEGRDGVRTPMPWVAGEAHGGFSQARPWLPLPKEHLKAACDLQEADPDSVLSFTRAFLAWRRAQPLLRWGGERVLTASHPLIAFERHTDDERLRCVANFSLEPRVFPVAEGDAPLAAPGAVSAVADGRLELPPFGFAVLG